MIIAGIGPTPRHKMTVSLQFFFYKLSLSREHERRKREKGELK